MEWIKRKVKIKDGVKFDGQSYAGFTGMTVYVGDNGMWWIDLDDDCVSKFSYEYMKLCKEEGTAYDSICLAEDNFEFIE